jgi:tetratricopeptide (TPR) repeat protein
MEKCDLAVADQNQAIQLDPQRFEGYVNRADALACQGKLDEAIADYSHALEIAPNSSWAYWTRGMAYEQKGDLKAAISDYSQALTNGADDTQDQPDWLLSRAGAYRARGDHEWALRDCASILRLVPNDPRGYYCRGMSEAALGQVDQARADFKQAITLTPAKTWDAWVIEAAQAELNQIGR